MAAKPRVPFELHAAAKLLANVEIAHGIEVELLPDGAFAVLRGDWNAWQIELHGPAAGELTTLLEPARGRGLARFAFSADGRRWAAVASRTDGTSTYAELCVGERGRSEPLCVARLDEYETVTRNALPRAASTLAFSPGGERVVVRLAPRGGGARLVDVMIPGGELRERALDGVNAMLFAQAFAPDGTLFAVAAESGAHAGLRWFPPGVTDRTGASAHPYGFALLPAPRGLWVLGAPRYAFRVGSGAPGAVETATEARRDRIEQLYNRASVAWDKRYLGHMMQSPSRPTPEPAAAELRPRAERTRVFENELLWETAYAARIGDDDALVSDGVAVYLWREGAGGFSRTLLIDDTQRCTTRALRIIGISARGDSFAVLWKKDAVGAKTVLSRFELKREALEP